MTEDERKVKQLIVLIYLGLIAAIGHAIACFVN